MITVARNTVGTAFNVMGYIAGKAMNVVSGVSQIATGVLGSGKQAAKTATDNARESVRDAAEWTDHRAEAVADKAADLGEDIVSALDEPDRRPYEERTVEELYALAVERDIAGRSTMNKAELIEALREER